MSRAQPSPSRCPWHLSLCHNPLFKVWALMQLTTAAAACLRHSDNAKHYSTLTKGISLGGGLGLMTTARMGSPLQFHVAGRYQLQLLIPCADWFCQLDTILDLSGKRKSY